MYQNLTVEEYKAQFYDAEQDHVLLDVRTVEEYEEVRIPGALHIPLDELTDRIEEVEELADKPLVMVCRTGVRSIMAAQILRVSGLDDAEIFNIKEGTMGWIQSGYPYEAG